MNQEESRTHARRVFNNESLIYKGDGFWLYSEDLSADGLISRKGLEYMASRANVLHEDLTLISRNDVQTYPQFKLGLGKRLSVLQLTRHYERDQERIITSKFKRLESKFNSPR